MALTFTQENAVTELIEAYHQSSDEDKIVCFKAPTGSGKTFMASEFISYVLSFREERIIVVFMTISTAELPKQLATKLKQYQEYHLFKDYEIKFIDSPSKNNKKIEDLKEFDVRKNMVFVLGISSFGKNTLFYQNDTLDSFLKQIKNSNYKLVFIRDEAHVGGKPENVDEKSVTEKLHDAAYFSIEMSATPKKAKKIIEITHEELVNNDRPKCLLKSIRAIKDLSDEIDKWKEKVNKAENNLVKNTVNEESNMISEEELIDFALWKFKQTQKEYEKLELGIRPALLIQVKNEAKEKHESFREYLELIERKLNENNLKYLIYLSEEKRIGRVKDSYNLPATLKYASNNDSEIDVIIFKTGPAAGWDIPRANTLLQLRNVHSETLSLQTLGRIKRNPYPDLEFEETTSKYYVYYLNHLPSEDFMLYKLADEFKEKGKNLLIGKIELEIDENKKEEAIKQYKNKVIEHIKSSDFNLDGHIGITYEYNNDVKVKGRAIENAISLKAENYKVELRHGEKLYLKYFEQALKNIQTDKSLEIKKYWLYQSRHKLYSFLNEALMENSNGYKYRIMKSEKIEDSYIFPFKKGTQIDFNISDIDKYGYIPCTEAKEKYQYLDSKPEKSFMEFFEKRVLLKLDVDISFFAKMPIAAGIYFEYLSKDNKEKRRSYIDFAIEYKNKIIMVEVKSGEHDLDKEKTNALSEAYKQYMSVNTRINEAKKELKLVIYWYNQKHKQKQHKFTYWDADGEPISKYSFQETFKDLFNLDE